MGYRVTALKIDPYLNVDAGTMSPFEHGEGKLLNHMHMLRCAAKSTQYYIYSSSYQTLYSVCTR